MEIFDKLTNWYFKRKSLPYWCIFAMDLLICYLAGILVFAMYFRASVALGNIVPISKTLGVYLLINIVFFRIYHTYSGIIRYSSFVDLLRVGKAMAWACFVSWLVHYIIIFYDKDFFFAHLHTRQIIPMYLLATVLMWAVRVVVKTLYEVSFQNGKTQQALIYGVYDGGISLAKSIKNEKPAKFHLKGFISHDPQRDMSSRMLMGERIYNVDENLKDVLENLKIEAVLISPLRNDEFRNNEQLQDILISAGVKIYMSPAMAEVGSNLQKEGDSYQQLKEISIEDLLPRDIINVDMKSVGELLTGKKILITGSAGSIGSEMVKQIAIYKPSELMLIDQAETPQHDIRLMMKEDYPDIKAITLVASIANEARMEKVFADFRPDYVFHAAAYKHVPMMEDNPSESIRNNVYGTKVIADLSVKYGVKKFVMISTDKAVNPTNVMGCSKRICEIYVQSLNNAKHETQFVTTRFGNVLGSNGSVIPLFEKQIKAGGPVTVTDPNIIRYFMLIPEACKLVLEAGTKGKGGEIFVFDMGKPVKIADLARRMIHLSGAKDVEIVFTGLRPGEKLYEEVLNDEETTKPSFHEKIRIAKVREYDYEEVSKEIDELIRVAGEFDDMKTVAAMKRIVPEFISKNSVYSQLDN